MGARVEQVETRAGAVVATLTGGAEVTAERLLVAAGRSVDLEGLGIEAAGLDAWRPTSWARTRRRPTSRRNRGSPSRIPRSERWA